MVWRRKAECVVWVAAAGDVLGVAETAKVRGHLEIGGALQVENVLALAMIELLAPLEVDY